MPQYASTFGLIAISSVVATGLVIAIWAAIHSDRRLRAAGKREVERNQHRIVTPDFDGLEKHFGHPLPTSFYDLYADRDLITSECVLIGVPNPAENDGECFVAYFVPADLESLAHPWPGTEDLFPFADNGAGDVYLIDTREADPQVIYYLHETEEKVRLGVSLSAFIAAPRRAQPDE